MNRALRRTLIALLAVTASAGIAWGLHVNQWVATVRNATLICLSCIGIQ